MLEILQNLQLNYGHIFRPLLVGTLVATVCGAVGCFIVLRRMSFLADAIAHSMLAGVVAGYLLIKVLFGQEAHLGGMLLGAMLAGMITVGLVGLVTKFTRVKEDTAIGIMYTGIFALGAFVISLRSVGQLIHIDIYHYIVGSVLAVTDAELWLLAIVASVVLGAVILFYRSLQLTTFDPVMAASVGIPVVAMEYLLTACTSLVVVSGVQVVGVILVVALMITPAASAYLLSDRLDRMVILSIVIGVIGFWLGFGLAMLVGASPGASVVVVMTLLFVAAVVFSPRYGLLPEWLRKRSSVSQEEREDILGSIVRFPEKATTAVAIAEHLKKPASLVQRVLRSLEQQELVSTSDRHVRLTDLGQTEASRILRAHRIWETYLEKAGTPESDLHPKAHVLEHIHDPATIDYLDDKLGHPIFDPHGKEIPSSKQTREAEFMLSLLREGDKVIVRRILPSADTIGLKTGQTLTIGPRNAAANSWSIETEDGKQWLLSHEQADGIWVEFQ